MARKIQFRGGLASEWSSVNPILLNRELGLETDTRKFKIGNGISAWNDLTYATQGEAGIIWMGAYNAATAYIVSNVVQYNGATYYCKVPSTGNLPTNTTYWDLMTSSGLSVTVNNVAQSGGNISLTQDNIPSGSTNKVYTATEQTRLANTSGTNTGNETTTTVGTLINGATSKTIPVDADMFGLMDSAASNVIKKLSWANVKATLKTYFDTLYTKVIVRNNLTTTVAGDALDATQGKILNDLVSTINVEMEERTTYGVVSGLVIAQQTVADMTVKCSAGVIYMADGTRYAPSAVASLTVPTADATNPRKDIVYVASTGTITYLAGTAGATPFAPATPAGGMLLAEIYVGATVTTILTANITDKKKPMWTEAWITPTFVNSWTYYSNASYTPNYYKDAFGIVHLKGSASGGSASTVVFTLPVGYRPPSTCFFAGISSSSGYARISISTTGDVKIDTMSGNFGSFDGITFKV